MQLPAPLHEALAPLFDALPPAQAMPALVVTHTAPSAARPCVEAAIADPALHARPDLAAGLWLYVDDLDRSHAISQRIKDPTGAFWHGIMHRREGDFANSHYWFRQAAGHPAMEAIHGYDCHAFIDAVAKAHPEPPPGLIDLQRREWTALFAWCASRE